MAKNAGIKVKIEVPEELKALAKLGSTLLGDRERPDQTKRIKELREACQRAEAQAERALKGRAEAIKELQTCRSERDHLRQQVESLSLRCEGGKTWQTERQSLRAQLVDAQTQQAADVATIAALREEVEVRDADISRLSHEVVELRDESTNPACQRLKDERAGLFNLIEGLLPAAKAHAPRLGEVRRTNLEGLIQTAERVLS